MPSRGNWKPTRHDAYNQVRLAIQANRLPDNTGIGAEAALPQPIAQDRNVGLSRGAFRIYEPAADERVDTYVGNRFDVTWAETNLSGVPAPVKLTESVDVCGQTLEGLHLLLPVDIVHRRYFDSWQIETGATSQTIINRSGS